MRRPSVKRLLADRTKIQVTIPYREPVRLNRELLKDAAGAQARIEYDAGVFRLTRVHLKDVIVVLALEFGAVDVLLEFNETEKCDTRCQRANPATFYECTCSCLARNHGGTGMGPEWLQVGDTTLINQQPRQHQFTVTRDHVTS